MNTLSEQNLLNTSESFRAPLGARPHQDPAGASSTHPVISCSACPHLQSFTKTLVLFTSMQESGNGWVTLRPCCHRAMVLSVTTLSLDGYQVSLQLPGDVSAGFWMSIWICCSGPRASRQAEKWIRRPGGKCLYELRCIKFCYERGHSPPITTHF